MSNKKKEPSALLSAVKEMNYDKIADVLKAQGLKKDSSWIDYISLVYAVFPKNISVLDYNSKTINIIKLLLKNGCRVRGPMTKKLCTPLYYAVQGMERDKKQALQIIEILLEAGASVTDKHKNEDTPLQLAMKNKKSRVVDLILSKYDVKNINVQNRDEMIHFVIACTKNYYTLVEDFLKKGMRISETIDCVHFHNLDWQKNSNLLHIAVKYEAASVVKVLLKYGVDFTSQDVNQQSPLHVAYYLNEVEKKKAYGYCAGNFDSIIDIILAAHTKNLNNPIDKEGLSHFHIACIKGNVALVKEFLKNGVNMKKLRSGNAGSDTFLNMAVRKKNQEFIKILVKHGADVNEKGSNGLTPLNLAMESKYHEVIETLLSLKADMCVQDDKGNSLVHSAFLSLRDTDKWYDKTSIAEAKKSEKLLDQMLSIHQGKMSNLSNEDGLSVFHIACARGNIDVMKNLIKNKNIDVNACVSRKSSRSPGFTALHFASSTLNRNIIKLLLKHKANIDAVNKEGLTPVMVAIDSIPKYNKVYEFVKSKLEVEAKLSDDDESDDGSESCDSSSSSNVKLNAKKKSKDSALIDLIYKEFKHMEIIQLFVKKNCTLDQIDKKGNPLLFRALSTLVNCFPGRYSDYNCNKNEAIDERVKEICNNFFTDNFWKMLNLLIEHGINVNARDREGNCIFHHIIESMKYEKKALRLETAELFLIHGANANIQNNAGQLAINRVINHNVDADLLGLFLKYNVDPNSADEKDGAPLHIAAYYSCNDHQDTTYYDIIEWLLANGADVNVRDSKGQTPIFKACKMENCGKAMELLLKNGADVHAKDDDGRTALFASVLNSNDNCVELLLEYGSDISVRDKYDMSVFKKLFTYHTRSNITAKKFDRVVAVLATHMRKLQLLGHHLDRDDLLYCKRLKYAYGKGFYPHDLKDMFKKEKIVDLDVFDEDDKLVAEMKKELKKQKATPVDEYTSLYDILFKDSKQMKNYVQNQDLKKYVKDKEMFPHFGCMLRLKFRAASTRYALLESAKKSSKVLTKKKLPDSCLHDIFAHLTNEDLQNLTGATH